MAHLCVVLKSEVNRALNRLVQAQAPAEIGTERLTAQSANLSAKLKDLQENLALRSRKGTRTDYSAQPIHLLCGKPTARAKRTLSAAPNALA